MKTLYRKNRIIITQDRIKAEGRKEVVVSGATIKLEAQKPTHEKVKCISPLGFYYWKQVWQNPLNNEAHLAFIDVYDGFTHTQLQYYTSWGDSRVSVDTRPWEIIPDSSGMPDHQVKALLGLVEKILKVVESEGPLIFMYGKKVTFHDLKKFVMEGLFGDIKGPRFQSDKEKILSHGFDPVTSFRKGKEK